VVKASIGDYQILFQKGDFVVIGSINGKPAQLVVSNDPDFNA